MRSSDGSAQLGIRDLSSNGTGLQPDGESLRKMAKDEVQPLADGIRVVLPVKLQAKKDETEDHRESFVVRHGHSAAGAQFQQAADTALTAQPAAASAGAMAAAALLTAEQDEDDSSSSSSDELQDVAANVQSSQAAEIAAAEKLAAEKAAAEKAQAAAVAAAAAKAEADAKRRQLEEAERAAAEKALREKRAAETAKRTEEQAAEIQKAAFEKAMSEFRQKRKQPAKDEQAEAVDAEEPAKRAKHSATGDALGGRLLAADAAAQLPPLVLPKFEKGEALVLKGNAAETTGKAEEAFENYRVGLAVILQEVLPHLGQKVAPELQKHILNYLQRAENLKARWGGGLPPSRRHQ